uniref:Uncharacterized protein n=1 Tax=Anguilla anguilla TaxID=7936 RepID=A0A0E9VET1_ANGAN
MCVARYLNTAVGLLHFYTAYQAARMKIFCGS